MQERHDELLVASVGSHISAETLETARAARDGDDEGRSLLEVTLRLGLISIRQANQVLSSTDERVLLCPDCRDYQALEWHKFGDFLHCLICGLDLTTLRQDLCLPQAENLTEALEYGPSLVGRIDGNIHVRRRLPQGRYAGWYAGQKRPRGERVVLMEVAPDIMGDEDRLVAFERAFELAGRLQHSVRPLHFELARIARRLFVVQTPMEGPSVRDLITARGPMAPLDMLRIMTPVAGLIRAGHAVGLHGFALFPDLVILEGHTEPRSLDVATGYLRRRVPGQLIYLPPEAQDGAPLDAAGDIYSYCAVCRYMLVGEPPFAHGNPEEVAAQVRAMPVPSLAAARADLQRELGDLLDAGMAKDPAERPAGMDVVLDQMESARQHQRWLAERERDALAERRLATAAQESPPAPGPSQPAAPEPTVGPQLEPAAAPDAPASPPAQRIPDGKAREIADLKRRIKDHVAHRRFGFAARALHRIISFEDEGEAYAAEAANARKLLARIESRDEE